MRYRLPVWLLLLYVALDLGNPLVQGAVSLTPAGALVWVEAVRQERAPAGAQAPRPARPVVPPRLISAGPRAAVLPAPGAPRRPTWPMAHRAAEPAAHDRPPAPPDDH